MAEILLAGHIGGAVATGLLIASGVGTLLTRTERLYRKLSVYIAFSGGFQLITGSLLALAMNGTVLSFCARIGLYTAAILATEAALFFAMRRAGILFPRKLVLTPMSAGTAASFAAFALLIFR